MTHITIKFSDGGLKQFSEKLARLGAEADTELARGLNDGGKVVTTLVRRALKTQMGARSYGVIKDATSTIPAMPTRNGLVFTITATGKGLPIKDFPYSAAVGSPVTASPWGSSRTFQRSFMTSVKGYLMARRDDSSRAPVRFLYGPSPAKELVKGESRRTFEDAVPRIIEPIVMRRLARLMPGGE